MSDTEPRLLEGWYLMSTRDLEIELAHRRDPAAALDGCNSLHLTIPDALAYRNEGNLPDELGRTLRIVLHVDSAADLTYLQSKRLLYEPDFHDAPSWRREGSKPVNVVPLRDPSVRGSLDGAWWEEPELKTLEEEWRRTGALAGISVPSEYRSFVYKTVLSLRSAGRPVTIDSIVSSVSRWLPAPDVERLETALRQAGSN